MLAHLRRVLELCHEALTTPDEGRLKTLAELLRPGHFAFGRHLPARPVIDRLETIRVRRDELVHVSAERREIRADLVDHVHAEGPFDRDLAYRLVREVETAGEVFGVLLDLFLHVLAFGRERRLALRIARGRRAVRLAVQRALTGAGGHSARVALGQLRLPEQRGGRRTEDVVVVRRSLVETVDVLRVHADLHVARGKEHQARGALSRVVQVLRWPEAPSAPRTVFAGVTRVDIVCD